MIRGGLYREKEIGLIVRISFEMCFDKFMV